MSNGSTAMTPCLWHTAAEKRKNVFFFENMLEREREDGGVGG